MMLFHVLGYKNQTMSLSVGRLYRAKSKLCNPGKFSSPQGGISFTNNNRHCSLYRSYIPQTRPGQTSTMKTATLLTLLGLLGANLQPTTAVPTFNVPRGNGNVNPLSWEFFLFQNTNCTGPQDVFIGNGSSVCRNDIRPGGALSFIRENISRGCVVELFREQNCTQKVRNITAQTESTCQALPGQVSSFDVKCAKPRFIMHRE